IICRWLELPGLWCESALSIIEQKRRLPSFPGADNQILMPVSIQIKPGNAGAKPAQHFRKKLLALKIVEGLLVMVRPNPGENFLKERLRGFGLLNWSWLRGRFV